MKILIFSILIFFIFGFNKSSSVIVAPPTNNYFDLINYREAVTLNFTEVTHLTENTFIEADEVILSADLITNGYKLKVITQRLTIRNSAKIIAFDRPQLAQKFVPDVGRTGGKGANAGGRSNTPGGTGKQGAEGKPGKNGEDGMKKPGEIFIFAANLNGNLYIDGEGQTGGKGGVGGKGGKGGPGGRGSKANTKCGRADTWAGHGGTGGIGGKGGKGGMGGIGGAPVPIVFIEGIVNQSTKTLISKPGRPGEPGEGGQPGDPGNGGPGGKGDSQNCGYKQDDTPSGYGGYKGVAGLPGEVGANQKRVVKKVTIDENLIRKLPSHVVNYVSLGQKAKSVSITTEVKKIKEDSDGNQIEVTELLTENYIEFKTQEINKNGKLGHQNDIEPSEAGDIQTQQIKTVTFDKSSEKFLDCQSSNKGILNCNLKNLEIFRQKITQPWFYFHWTRTFEYLLIDSLHILNENISEYTNITSDDLLDILESSNNRDLSDIITIWEDEFLKPLILSEHSKYIDHSIILSANKLIDILKTFSKKTERIDTQNLSKRISKLLKQTKQKRTNLLLQAIDACTNYNNAKSQINEFLWIVTNYYSIPVCEGETNNLLANSDPFAEVVLLSEFNSSVPAILQNKLINKTVSNYFYTPYLSNTLHAFEFESESETKTKNLEIANIEDLLTEGLLLVNKNKIVTSYGVVRKIHTKSELLKKLNFLVDSVKTTGVK